MEMCSLSLYLRQIVEYDAGLPPQSQSVWWRNSLFPAKKRKPITLRSARRPVITLGELLLSPNKKLSGNFKENRFTQSTRKETNVTFTPQYIFNGRAIQNQGIRIGNHQRQSSRCSDISCATCYNTAVFMVTVE